MAKYDWKNPDLNVDEAAQELVEVLDRVHPPLKGSSPRRTTESPMVAFLILDSMVTQFENAGQEYIKVSDLRQALNKMKGTF